jgi:SAM-dependent methyltransferase
MIFEGRITTSCHVCAGNLICLPSFSLGGRVTSDCRPWFGSAPLASCEACGLVQKILSKDWFSEVSQIYSGYQIYAQSGGGDQLSFNSSQGSFQGRSQSIASWLLQNGWVSEEGDLLDIGCGNGSFLRSFGALRPRWRMVGLELDDRNKLLVEAIPGVTHLHQGGVNDLTGQFDLIVLIHTLEHIAYPHEFINQTIRLLAPNGRLLIQVPNIDRSPFDLLIADHCSHFSERTVAQTFRQSAVSIQSVSSNCVPKELTVLLKRSSNCGYRPELATSRPRQDMQIALAHLEWLAALLQTGSSADGHVGIFGSSIAASWLASSLGLNTKAMFFVDEDSNRVGRQHLSLPIVRPADALGSPILMPLTYLTALEIRQRLAPHKLDFILPPKDLIEYI